ncbi:MAG: pyrimidine-nucleoside phosphorylase [Clostridiales bacterium]|nr:pyrimidine-nucleoside phosphorylase [Clostridiales bacterium]
MRMYDIIQKKRDGLELTDAEIEFAVEGYVRGGVPDYQMSALLMAVYFRGMTPREIKTLTLTMMRSGETVDLSAFGDLTVDKHSTGGVGDKTTLIVAPIVACLGGVVAKMSGRGLGHTGGTVDKLEAIPGFRTEMDRGDFLRQVREIGVAVVGQSGHLAPADKKIYALRDVTATVESIPLIASSIMSKKLASGAKNIVLDVKVGSGAFMKTREDAERLARAMVGIGTLSSRRVTAVLTNMDIPLGRAVGNSLEVLEAVDVLAGRGPADLVEVCSELAARMLCLARGWAYEESIEKVRDALASGAALEKFRGWIARQGGDASFIESPEKLGTAPVTWELKAEEGGYISSMDAERIGKAAAVLGAGREKAGDPIDYTAGIVLLGKTGDEVREGGTLATLYTSKKEKIPEAAVFLRDAIRISPQKPAPQPLIFGVVE